jgi:ketosteroid isomerase-like protein
MSEFSDLSPRSVILAVQRAIVEGDFDALVSHFAPDAVVEFPRAAEAGVPARIQGRESIRQVATGLRSRFADDGQRLSGLENLVVHESTDSEVFVVEFEALGEVGTGDYRMPDIQVWRVRDGLVVSVRDYLGARALPPVKAPASDRIPGTSAWG